MDVVLTTFKLESKVLKSKSRIFFEGIGIEMDCINLVEVIKLISKRFVVVVYPDFQQ